MEPRPTRRSVPYLLFRCDSALPAALFEVFPVSGLRSVCDAALAAAGLVDPLAEGYLARRTVPRSREACLGTPWGLRPGR
jgi:hypothetical protein